MSAVMPRSGNGTRSSADEVLRATPGFARLEHAGGIGGLLVASVRAAVTPPYSWWRDAIVESSVMLRRCMIPLAICVAVFMLGFGFFVLGGITKTLGASDREGGAVIIGIVREACIWLTGMVFAGVAGSAMTADIGARKVREELDALAVLGVDRIRAIVVPRFVASIIAAPILGLICILAQGIVNFTLAPAEFGFTVGGLLASTKGSIITYDIYGALIRLFIIGAVVGAVACYKGMTCEGGTAGVGRAVNQTIVIAFFFVWGLDAFFNLAYLSLFPEAQVDFKG